MKKDYYPQQFNPVTQILKVSKEVIEKLHNNNNPVVFHYNWNADTLLGHCIRFGKKKINKKGEVRYELPISNFKIKQLKTLINKHYDGAEIKFLIGEDFADKRYQNVYLLQAV